MKLQKSLLLNFKTRFLHETLKSCGTSHQVGEYFRKDAVKRSNTTRAANEVFLHGEMKILACRSHVISFANLVRCLGCLLRALEFR